MENVYDRLVEDIRDNPSFMKWFGNSVAVDSNGQPVVCYHGSHTFNSRSFDPQRTNAFCFTTDKDIGNMYASEEKAKYLGIDKWGASLTPCYLSIQHPFTEEDAVNLYRKYPQFKDMTVEQYIKMDDPLETFMDFRSAVLKTCKEKGYDGVWLCRGKLAVVFDPKKVKSAMTNKGSYSTDSDFLDEDGPIIMGELVPDGDEEESYDENENHASKLRLLL